MNASRNSSPLILAIGLACAILLWPIQGLQAREHTHKVGLALSGGGARGAAHIGILKVLEREKIPIDCIAGTSFGALVGGLYALGYKAVEIERIFLQQDMNMIFSDTPERKLSPLSERRSFRYQGQLAFNGINPELPAGLREGQRIIEILNTLTAQRMIAAQYEFDRLPIPFRAVATDLLTGKPYVFSRGRMTEAIRASIAIPMVFTPVVKDDMLLADGGLADNLPADVVRDMGADIVIGSDITTPLLKKDEIKSIFNVMDQALSLLMKQSVVANEKLTNLILRPNLDGFSFNSFNQIEEIIRRGEMMAEARLAEIKDLVVDVPPHTPPAAPVSTIPPVIESIRFIGLKKIPESQLQKEIRSRPGQPMNPDALAADIRRLYATRLFDHVDSNLEPIRENQYRLTYLLKETPLNTLGASIRYDKDYNFVALAELTARQLFGTTSSATLSSQFGGLENHSISLRYINPRIPFLYIEPRVHLRRRERIDFRSGELVDKFTDKRIGGQLMIGGTFLKRIEVEGGYRDDRVSVLGGTPPNRQEGVLRLAGVTFRANRDTLDAQDFPHSGMLMRMQADRRGESMGGDISYTKLYGEWDRYLPASTRGTLQLRAALGFTQGPTPFYDQFFVGGLGYSDGGPIRFIGFDRDELMARQIGVVGGSYRYRIFSHPLSFATNGYMSAYYNLASISYNMARPYGFKYFNGAGIGLSLETLLGPIRIAGGWGEGGRIQYYFSLGPGF